MHELDQAWLKEEWRALVGDHVVHPVSNAEQAEECLRSQMQTLVSVWLLEYLQQSLAMETYFRSLYQNCPWEIGTSVYTVLCSMMYELRPLYGKHISLQLPRRYEVRCILAHWAVYDTQEQRILQWFRQKAIAVRAATFFAEKHNGYHFCIGDCNTYLPHTHTRVSIGKKWQHQHAQCQICGEERIVFSGATC
jgi:hypothetical protein